MSRLDIARQYHALGMNVIPVTGKSAGKWERWQTERQTAEHLKSLSWSAPCSGIAAIAGGVSGGLVALDLDEAPGLPSLETALGKLGLPREYEWAVKTPGHGGGWHIWVVVADLWDALEAAGKPVKSALRGPFPGTHHIELRWMKCYTLLPPSAHPDGGLYQFLTKTMPNSPPAVVAANRLARLTEWEAGEKPALPAAAPAPGKVSEALAYHCGKVALADQGTRNDQLNASAYAMGRYEVLGADRDTCRDALAEAARRAGLPEHEIQRTFDSGWGKGTREPRSAFDERIVAEPPPPEEADTRVSVTDCVTLRDALNQLERYTKEPMPPGVLFPWEEVNRLARSMRPGWLTYLAGYTSHGKTAAAIECAIRAGDQGHRVLFISGEMSPEEIAVRAAQRMGMSSRRLYDGKLSERDGEAIRGAAQVDSSERINIIYTRRVPQIEQAVKKYRPDFVIVDHLQFLDIGKSTRLEGTTKNSQALKDIARRYEVPVMALSQLRRPDRTMREEEPRLDDLRDSGSIEQDADQVLFVWREKIEREAFTNWPTHIGKFIVAKARMGELGKAEYEFDPVHQRFKVSKTTP